MIACNFTNSPNVSPDAIDVAARTAEVVAMYPGFPGYIYHNPDQPGSSGDGMGWPDSLYGPAWKEACKVASPAQLWARIGGCKTGDIPMLPGKIDTMCKRLGGSAIQRRSPGIIFDFMSGDPAEDAAKRLQPVVAANGLVCVSEANAKRPYIVPDSNTWICAEWILWDWPVPVTHAVNGWNPTRWKISELLAKPDVKVVVEITSIERRGFGFTEGVADWRTSQVELAKMFNDIDPARVIVSVRATQKNADALRKLNG